MYAAADLSAAHSLLPLADLRAAFGADVVDHYLNNARVELDAFEAAVTDSERARGIGRL